MTSNAFDTLIVPVCQATAFVFLAAALVHAIVAAARLLCRAAGGREGRPAVATVRRGHPRRRARGAASASRLLNY